MFFYVFNYTDHLGNIRVSYGNDPHSKTLKTLEENHYYPFGLKHTNYNTYKRKFTKEEEPVDPPPGTLGTDYKIKQVLSGEMVAYKYKYNGKEWQYELGLNMYDMDMRDYDPAIGRWVAHDPVVHFDYSPYSAFDNNPVFWADPSGADSQTDIWGRNTRGANGMYIPSDQRGDRNSNSWLGNGTSSKENNPNDKEKKNANSNSNLKLGDIDWKKYWGDKMKKAKKWAKGNLGIEASISGNEFDNISKNVKDYISEKSYDAFRFSFDVVEVTGGYLELVGLFAAPLTEGASLELSLIGADLSAVGTFGNSFMDAFIDDNYKMASYRIFKFTITAGTGRVLDNHFKGLDRYIMEMHSKFYEKVVVPKIENNFNQNQLINKL